MRKKIGKRIGPVPIALVAVLALAAFISAGLLAGPWRRQPPRRRAGRLTRLDAPPPADDVKVVGRRVQKAMRSRRPLSWHCPRGRRLYVSGDSVDVVFENTNESRFTATNDDRKRSHCGVRDRR